MAYVLQIPDASPTEFQNQDVNAHPLLLPVTSTTVLLAFLSYNISGVGSLGNFIFLSSTLVGLFGLWVVCILKGTISEALIWGLKLLFAGTSAISKKTGADKRTSAFIFGNKHAASVRKKEWRKQQTRNKAS